jgi:hypothetical protein
VRFDALPRPWWKKIARPVDNHKEGTVSKQIVVREVSSWLGVPSQKAAQNKAGQESESVEHLVRILNRTREKRDAIASERESIASNLTALDSQIAELEARLSEQQDRLERERICREIQGIKKRLEDTATAFASATAGLSEATETAAGVVPEARDLYSFLRVVGPETQTAIDLLLRELQRRRETVRVSHAERNPAQPAKGPPNPTQNHDRLVLLWPARRADRLVDDRSESGGGDIAPMRSA